MWDCCCDNLEKHSLSSGIVLVPICCILKILKSFRLQSLTRVKRTNPKRDKLMRISPFQTEVAIWCEHGVCSKQVASREPAHVTMAWSDPLQFCCGLIYWLQRKTARKSEYVGCKATKKWWGCSECHLRRQPLCVNRWTFHSNTDNPWKWAHISSNLLCGWSFPLCNLSRNLSRPANSGIQEIPVICSFPKFKGSLLAQPDKNEFFHADKWHFSFNDIDRVSVQLWASSHLRPLCLEMPLNQNIITVNSILS